MFRPRNSSWSHQGSASYDAGEKSGLLSWRKNEHFFGCRNWRNSFSICEYVEFQARFRAMKHLSELGCLFHSYILFPLELKFLSDTVFQRLTIDKVYHETPDILGSSGMQDSWHGILKGICFWGLSPGHPNWIHLIHVIVSQGISTNSFSRLGCSVLGATICPAPGPPLVRVRVAWTPGPKRLPAAATTEATRRRAAGRAPGFACPCLGSWENHMISWCLGKP